MLLGVMDEFGIVDREAFLEHAAAFDVDMNGYLKKVNSRKPPKRGINFKAVPKVLSNLPWFNATKHQICPKCGETIVRGTTACGSCGRR